MLLLSQTFSKWFVVLEYHLNKEFISQKLCVNKAKPKLHCNGKCQMMKRLAEEEKQISTNTTNHTSKIKIQEVLFSIETVQPGDLPLTVSFHSYNEEPPAFLFKATSVPVFHPPVQA
jgi:hypothetical protein